MVDASGNMETFIREVEIQADFWREHRRKISELKKVMLSDPARFAPEAASGTAKALKMLEERGAQRWGLRACADRDATSYIEKADTGCSIIWGVA
jgi:hypothetical protein